MKMILKPMRILALLSLTGGMLTACGTMGPGGSSSLLERDIYDMRNKLDRYLEEQTTADRKFDYRLSAIEEALQGRNDATRTSLDELEKRFREQIQEINALRSEVEKLSFALDRTGGRGTLGNGSPMGTPDLNATPLSGSSANQAFETALKQYNLGNFAQAREGFRQALEQKPTGETQIQVLFWMAESCYQLKEFDAASEYYIELIKANRSHSKAWVSLERLADIKISQGDNEHGVAMLQQIVEYNPDYPDIDRVKGKIDQIQQGNGSAATEPAPATPAQ